MIEVDALLYFYSIFMNTLDHFLITRIPVHPLTYGALFFIAGIYCAAKQTVHECLMVLLFVIGCTFLLRQHTFSKTPLRIYCATFFLLGTLSYLNQCAIYTSLQKKYMQKTCTIQGIIESKNQSFDKKLSSTTLLLTKIGIEQEPIKHTHSLKVRLYTTKPTKFDIGDTIRIYNVHMPSSPKDNKKSYLLKEQILFSTFISYKSTIRLIHHPTTSIQRTIYAYREKIYKQLEQKIHPTLFSYMSSLFLGNRTGEEENNPDMNVLFKTWGISHFIARSGLHLVIIISIWEYLLKIFPIGYVLKQIIILFMTFIYTFLSWTSISFLRALIVLFYYKCTIFFDKQVHAIHGISLITTIVLLYNPHQLFFADFQLSFFLTFALIWFNQLQKY